MNTRANTLESTEITLQKSYFPWVIVALSSMFLFYKYVMQISPSIMTQQLMQAFHINGMGLGNLAATFFYSYLITQLFVGVLLDKLGPRFLSSAAILMSALGTYFFAIADSLTTACLARTLMGVGAAFATVSYMKLAANWFEPNKFAFIGGLLATAAMIGAIFGQAPLAWLVGVTGWRESLTLCAWVGIITSVLFLLIIRDNPKSALLTTQEERYRVTLKDISKILRNKQNWLLTLYAGTAFSPVAVFGGLWGDPFIGEAYNLSPTQSATLVSLVFFGLAVGAPILGIISDRSGQRRQIMLYGTILSLISITSVIYLNHLPIWLVGSLLFTFGFGIGGYMLGFTIGKELNPIALSATIIAMINSGDAIMGAFTEPMIGKFLDLGWDNKVIDGVHHFSLHDFHVSFLIIPIYLMIATALVFFIKEKRV